MSTAVIGNFQYPSRSTSYLISTGNNKPVESPSVPRSANSFTPSEPAILSFVRRKCLPATVKAKPEVQPPPTPSHSVSSAKPTPAICETPSPSPTDKSSDPKLDDRCARVVATLRDNTASAILESSTFMSLWVLNDLIAFRLQESFKDVLKYLLSAGAGMTTNYAKASKQNHIKIIWC